MVDWELKSFIVTLEKIKNEVSAGLYKGEQEVSNVRSLDDARRRKGEEREEMSEDIMETYFEDIMKHNKSVKERRRKEIAQANKSVLRSYRIKS